MQSILLNIIVLRFRYTPLNFLCISHATKSLQASNSNSLFNGRRTWPPSLHLWFPSHLFKLSIQTIVSLHHKIDPFIWIPTNSNAKNAILVDVNIACHTSRKPQHGHILHVKPLLFAEVVRVLREVPFLQIFCTKVHIRCLGTFFGHALLAVHRSRTDLKDFPWPCQIWWLGSFSLWQWLHIQLYITAPNVAGISYFLEDKGNVELLWSVVMNFTVSTYKNRKYKGKMT